MKKRNYVILVCSLILFIFSIWLWTSRPLMTETLNVRFMVGKNIGFNVDASELNFGRVTPGGSATRNVDIRNEYNHPVKVKIFASRSIAEYIFSEFDSAIPPDNSTKIPITLKVPKNMEYGNYSGKIKFKFKKAG